MKRLETSSVTTEENRKNERRHLKGVRRAVGSLAVLAASVALVAGCDSGVHNAGPDKGAPTTPTTKAHITTPRTTKPTVESTTTTSPTPSTTPTTEAPSTTAPPTTPSTAPPSTTTRTAVAGCTTDQLQENVINPNGAAGSTYYTITFRNVGSSACTLYGYPGVSLEKYGKEIGQSASWDHSVPPASVNLNPGATAYAALRITDAYNYPPTECTPEQAAGIAIIAPNTVEPETVLMSKPPIEGCAPGTSSEVNLLQTGPVVALPDYAKA